MTTAHRIAYLVSSYPAASHVFILREVLGLRERGFDIQTLSINADQRDSANLNEQERAEQLNTIVIKNWPRLHLCSALVLMLLSSRMDSLKALYQSWCWAKQGWRGHLWALAYWVEAMLVAYTLKTKQINHLHVHFGNEAALVGALSKRICHCQLSYTIHGPDEFFDVSGQQLRAKINAADLIICISQFARAQLMRISEITQWRKMQLVRLGVAPDYAATCNKEQNRAAQANILCVGRLCINKGQRVLLQALALLARKNIYPHATLVGTGDDLTTLQELTLTLGLSQQVQFLGALNAQAVRDLYQDATLFVLPSFAEGIPVVLMEAMASGVPCISTQINGIPELISDEKTGLLVSAGDADALSLAIARLLEQPALAQQLANAAKHQLRQHYHLAHNLDQLAMHFRGLQQELDHAKYHHATYTASGIAPSLKSQ